MRYCDNVGDDCSKQTSRCYFRGRTGTKLKIQKNRTKTFVFLRQTTVGSPVPFSEKVSYFTPATMCCPILGR